MIISTMTIQPGGAVVAQLCAVLVSLIVAGLIGSACSDAISSTTASTGMTAATAPTTLSPTTLSSTTGPSNDPGSSTTAAEPFDQRVPLKAPLDADLTRWLDGLLLSGVIHGTRDDEAVGVAYEILDDTAGFRSVCCPGPWSGTAFDGGPGQLLYTSEDGGIISVEDMAVVDSTPVAPTFLHARGMIADSSSLAGRPTALITNDAFGGTTAMLLDLESGAMTDLTTVERGIINDISHGREHVLLTVGDDTSSIRLLVVTLDGSAPSLDPPTASDITASAFRTAALSPDDTTIAVATEGPGGTEVVVWQDGVTARFAGIAPDSDTFVHRLDFDGTRIVAEIWTTREEAHPIGIAVMDTSDGEWRFFAELVLGADLRLEIRTASFLSRR